MRRAEDTAPETLKLHLVRSLEQFLRDSDRAEDLLGPWSETPTAPNGGPFEVPGYCQVDSRRVLFRMDEIYATTIDGRVRYNWRERMVCPVCALNNRMRASVHLFEMLVRPTKRTRVWITEQVTPLYAELARRHPTTIGSEFAGEDKPPGWISEDGIRHEDMTCASFADKSLDAILSFDVLEHVPDIISALRECARVLAPGGLFLFTAPFLYVQHETRTRAERLPDGSIRHLLPPEYHGNPVQDGGVLCYREFGWDVLDSLRTAGFADAYGVMYQSTAYGYQGGIHLMFVGRKRRGWLPWR